LGQLVFRYGSVIQVSAFNRYALQRIQVIGTLFFQTCSGASVYQEQPVSFLIWRKDGVDASLSDNPLNPADQKPSIYFRVAAAAIPNADACGFFFHCS
jgi:hypothetical protein